MDREKLKELFKTQLRQFASTLNEYACTGDGQWNIKGFIDVNNNIYNISNDTKIISKILEIQLYPKLLEFASTYGYILVLPDHQNYYPDVSFVSINDESIKFAVDLKTTYKDPNRSNKCNGFTLGSHGKYFIDRKSTKNIQYPYEQYIGHFCLCIIYTRNGNEDRTYSIDDVKSIPSVIKDLHFIALEKWEISSDKSGSGNTANIGSITNIDEIINGNGAFKHLGEHVFDDYWMIYGKIVNDIKITSLKKYFEHCQNIV